MKRLYRYVRLMLRCILIVLALGIGTQGTHVLSKETPPLQPSYGAHTLISAEIPDKPKRPNLDSALNQLIDTHLEGKQKAAAPFAPQQAMISDGEFAQVTILGWDADIAGIEHQVEALGGDVEVTWDNEVQARVPIAQLEALAAHEDVRFIRTPLRPVPDTGEGDLLINGPTWRGHHTGDGVKVAILDSGFDEYMTLIGAGELPSAAEIITASFRADGVFTPTTHGTACAEIVYDIAPGATYYLVNYGTSTEFSSTVSYLETEGVDIVSHSVSFFNAGPYDGTSSISQRIDTAATNGIFWTNSAGNRGEQHWEGMFDNSIGDGSHDWNTQVPTTTNVNQIGWLPADTLIRAYLSWDDWNLSNNDYDLYLKYTDGTIPWTFVGSSTTTQNGSQPPTESIVGYATQDGWYGLYVYQNSGAANHYLELFTTQQNLQYNVASGSVPNCGDAAGAVTTGAVAASDYSATGLMAYSGRGPTNGSGGGAPDGTSRTKPDIASPTNTGTTTSYGIFGGTSAATPHTAGAAALYVEAYRDTVGGGTPPTRAQTQTYLEEKAEALHDWGTDTDGIKNDDFGAGGLDLGTSLGPNALRALDVQTHASLAVPGLILACAGTGAASGLWIRRRRRRRGEA
jgi:hypothetical protein